MVLVGNYWPGIIPLTTVLVPALKSAVNIIFPEALLTTGKNNTEKANLAMNLPMRQHLKNASKNWNV